MIINHQYRFVYVAAPRTASSSVRRWLSAIPGTVVDDEHHRMEVPAECRGYFVFGTVRDPVERLLSLWRYHWQNDPDRRPLSQYLIDLPGMDPFHSRSQTSWYKDAGPDVLLPTNRQLQQCIVDQVFVRRGFHHASPSSLPWLNGTRNRRGVDRASVLRHVEKFWADDCQLWEHVRLLT